MKTKRLVAICDVLGFRKIVESTPLSGLEKRYEKLVSNAVSTTRHHIYYVSEGGRRKYGGTLRVGHCIFSDTIFLWSRKFSSKENPIDSPSHDFFLTTSRLIGFSILMGFPLRVGIAFGECVVKPTRGVYLGQTIVDAYLSEQRQDWVGAACHPSCSSVPYFSHLCLTSASGEQFGPLIEYDIPLKSSIQGPRLKWTLDWPHWSDFKVERILAEKIRESEDDEIAVKFKNSLDYYLTRTKWRRDLEERIHSGSNEGRLSANGKSTRQGKSSD